MRQFPVSPQSMFFGIWRNRNLVNKLIRREVVGRYRGSFMGLLWSFFNPVLMLAVYTFVFSVVFKLRWSGGSESKTEFALILFAGMIVFTLFSECVNRASGLILDNVNYVKKVVFPLEILPFVVLGTALFHLTISTVVWLVFYFIFFGIPHITVLLFPLVLVPLLFFTIGVSWAIAALGVYLRDVGQIVGILTTALMFLSPIFYPVSSLPIEFQAFMNINPLTIAIEQTRQVLVWGEGPDMKQWGIFCLVSMAVAWIGFFWFQKTRKGFADVL